MNNLPLHNYGSVLVLLYIVRSESGCTNVMATTEEIDYIPPLHWTTGLDTWIGYLDWIFELDIRTGHVDWIFV